MRDLSAFAGYSSPEDVVADRSLSAADKTQALLSWRGAVERLRRARADEIKRQDSFVAEIDRALAKLDKPRRCR